MCVINVQVREKIQEISDDPKYGAKEFSRLSGVGRATTWRIVNKPEWSPRESSIRKIARAFPVISILILSK